MSVEPFLKRSVLLHKKRVSKSNTKSCGTRQSRTVLSVCRITDIIRQTSWPQPAEVSRDPLKPEGSGVTGVLDNCDFRHHIDLTERERLEKRRENKMKTLLIVLLSVLLFLPGALLAQQQASTSSQGQQSGQAILSKAESLKGSTVVDPQGQQLGKVDSVTLDMMSGQISYVVVEPDKGNKHIPVPYNMFGLMRDGQLVLNMDKDRLDTAPSYEKRDQPNWSNQYWSQQVASFWGMAPVGIMTGQASGTQQTATMGSSTQQPATGQPTPMATQPPTGTSQQPVGSAGGPATQPGGTATDTTTQPMGGSGVSSAQPGSTATDTSTQPMGGSPLSPDTGSSTQPMGTTQQPSTSEQSMGAASSPSSDTTTQRPMDTTTQQPGIGR